MCVAIDFYLSKPMQIILVGNPKDQQVKEMLHEINSRHKPNKIILFADQKSGSQFLSQYSSVIKDTQMVEGKPTAYICENYSCSLPVNTSTALGKILDQ